MIRNRVAENNNDYNVHLPVDVIAVNSRNNRKQNFIIQDEYFNNVFELKDELKLLIKFRLISIFKMMFLFKLQL